MASLGSSTPQSTSAETTASSSLEHKSSDGYGSDDAKFSDWDKRIQALEKSDKSVWRKAGTILGILAGLIAIPKALYEAWIILFPAPRVEMMWIDDVDLRYDSQTQRVEIVYSLSISNAKGTAEDRITSASITLEAPQAEPYTVGTPYIYFQASQQKLKIPLTIGKGESKDLELHVSFIPEFAKYALDKPGARATKVSFSLQSRSRDKPVSRKFCLLNMDSEDLKAVMAGQPWHPSITSCKES